MPLLECIAATPDSNMKTGDLVHAKFLRRDKERGRSVFNLFSHDNKQVGRVYWMDSGEIYRCCYTGDKFKEVTGE